MNRLYDLFKKYIIDPIYVIIRINIRIIVASCLLVYLTYPVIIKIRQISATNKPFFTSLASEPLKPLPPIDLAKFNKGIFDPNGDYKNNINIKFNEIYHNWDNTIEQKNLNIALETSIKAGRRPYITIEPWSNDYNISNDQHLLNIVNGKYDNYISNSCRKINQFKELVLVNWGESADFGSKSRYDWATDNSSLYKQAYKQWYNICSKNAKNIIYVWTAFGNDKTSDYYPGDELVNILGLNIQILQSDLPKTNNYKKEALKILQTKIKVLNSINRFIYLTDFAIENSLVNNKYTTEFISILNNNEIENVLGVIFLNTDQSPSLNENEKSLNYKLDPQIFPL